MDAKKNTYDMLLENEMKGLNKLESFEEIQQSHAIQEVISTIQNEGKENRRFTFKINEKIGEQISSTVTNDPNHSKELILPYVNALLESTDLMEHILNAAKESELSDWINQLERAIEKSKNNLSSVGVEEIEVLGHPIDGETMESLGTVSCESYPDFDKFTVAEVLENGYRFRESGELIRPAKVRTVY